MSVPNPSCYRNGTLSSGDVMRLRSLVQEYGEMTGTNGAVLALVYCIKRRSSELVSDEPHLSNSSDWCKKITLHIAEYAE